MATLRADYFDRPLQHPAFAAILDGAAVNVKPLSGDELERAIVEPARATGVKLEPGLAARIAADAAGRPASLPLLQYTLAELFDRRSGALLTLVAYEELGGISGALAARAEALYLSFDASGRSEVRRVFGRLVSPSGETADVRRRARVSEFGADHTARLVLDRYGDARLLTFDRDTASREPTVEVAHEALLREWPRLPTWLAEDMELLRALGSLSVASDRWEVDGREPADLLRGARLASATELVHDHPDRVRQLDAEFVQASAAAAEAEAAAARRGRRRQGLLAAGIGTAVLVAAAAGVFAMTEQDRADAEARAAALAAEEAAVGALIDRAREADDPKLGILLALEARRRDPGPETDRALLRAIGRSGGGETVASYPPLVDATCTAGPGWVAADGTSQTAVVDGEAVRRDLDSGTVTTHGKLPFGGCGSWLQDMTGSVKLAIDSEGEDLWLGTVNGDWTVRQALGGSAELADPRSLTATRFLVTAPGVVRLVDAANGRPVGTAIGRVGPSPVTAMAADGSRFAVVREGVDSGTPNVTVHDAGEGRVEMRLELPADPITMALDPSEDQLLVATADRRLLTFDLKRGEVVGDVDYTGSDSSSVSVADDGRVTIVSPGTPGTIETLDRSDGDGERARIQVNDLVGGRGRPDGRVVLWDNAGHIDVIDPAGQPLAVSSIELSAFGIDPFRVRIVGGKVEMAHRILRTTVVDLETGEAEELSIDDDDGKRFATYVNPFVVGDGYAAITLLNDVAWWRDGDLIDRLTPGSIPGTRSHRYAVRGAYLALAGLLPGGDYEVHLLALDEGRIERRFTVRTSESWMALEPMDDGGLLIVDDQAVARRWDPSGQLLDELHIAFERVELVAFDGASRIVIAHDGGTPRLTQLKLVDLDSGESRLISTFAPVEAIGFAQDGDMLVMQTTDGAVQIRDPGAGFASPVVWNGDGTGSVQPWYDPATDSVWVGDSRRVARIPLARAAWDEIACQRAGRDLTSDEWERWVPGDRPQARLCAGTTAPAARLTGG